MGKSLIINRIYGAATKYKEYFIGNTYMFIYDNKYIEVLFKKSSFLHLTGVNTNLNAEDFYNHSIKINGLRPKEIFFDREHPYDLAERKTQCLSDLYKITITDVLIATDIVTMTFTYTIGITNLEFIICLGNDTDAIGRMQSKCMVPYSFRVEEINNNKFDKLHEVTHVLKKITGQKKYNMLTFGNEKTIEDLPLEIQEKIDLQ